MTHDVILFSPGTRQVDEDLTAAQYRLDSHLTSITTYNRTLGELRTQLISCDDAFRVEKHAHEQRQHDKSVAEHEYKRVQEDMSKVQTNIDGTQKLINK